MSQVVEHGWTDTVPWQGDGPQRVAVMEGFRSASDHVVRYLLSQWGWTRWTVGRVEERDGLWIVLAMAAAPESTVRVGSILSWPDTMCAQHIADDACVTPDIDTAARADVTFLEGLPGIATHAVAAIHRPGGEVAATLCGVDLHPPLGDTGPLVATLNMFAELLGLVLAGQERADEAARRAERKSLEALTDPLTGLPNRRAWDRFLDSEERRCERDGHSVAIVIVDLDDLKPVNDRRGHAAGDEMLRRAAAAIRASTRKGDLAARIGGDEFGVVAVHCDAVTSRQLIERVEGRLAEAGIRATVGAAMRRPGNGLTDTWQQADRAMYERKGRRRRT